MSEVNNQKAKTKTNASKLITCKNIPTTYRHIMYTPNVDSQLSNLKTLLFQYHTFDNKIWIHFRTFEDQKDFLELFTALKSEEKNIKDILVRAFQDAREPCYHYVQTQQTAKQYDAQTTRIGTD